MLSLGRKTNELLNKSLQTNNKKELTVNINKWVADEKVK
jgi:DNA mismatch repair protein MutS2